MNFTNIKKAYIENQDVFLLLWQIKYVKRKGFTWVTFSRLQAKLPSGFVPTSSLQQELLPGLTPWWHKGWMFTNTQGNKGFLCKWGKCRRHKGLQTWSRGNLSIIILLSPLLSPPLGLPFEVFLYHLQSSFLVRSWLGIVRPRALTGDQQVKPAISARK